MSKNQTTKYFIYARKSSESEDRQVQSIEDQISYLNNIARMNGLEILEIYEESKSAKAPFVRPLFMEMMARIQNGEADGILCWELNRLARNMVDGGQIIDLLQQSVIKEIRTSQGIHFPSDNVLTLAVYFGMANQFIIDLRKNCLRGMKGKADRGWFPSKAPLGYLNEKAERTIIKDPERFAQVRKMWDLMLSGQYTPSKIKNIANDEWGFRTPKSKREGGGPLSNSILYKLFTNEFYAGVFIWAGKEYVGRHAPMITLAEYDKVQILLGKKGKPRYKLHEYAFTGLISCGECGANIIATEKTKLVKATGQLKNYVYYYCNRNKKDKSNPCKNQRPIALSELEDQIVTYIEQITIHPLIKQWALEVLGQNTQQHKEEIQREREALTKTVTATQKELDNLTKMRYRDLIDDDTFIKESEAVKGRLLRLKLKENEPDTVTEWEREIEAWEFASSAQVRFIKGATKEKKDVFMRIGSNFILKDQKLLLTKDEWLVRVKEKAEKMEVKSEQVEPGRSSISKPQSIKFQFFNDGEPT